VLGDAVNKGCRTFQKSIFAKFLQANAINTYNSKRFPKSTGTQLVIIAADEVFF
jgi:hypothetical protein